MSTGQRWQMLLAPSWLVSGTPGRRRLGAVALLGRRASFVAEGEKANVILGAFRTALTTLRVKTELVTE